MAALESKLFYTSFEWVGIMAIDIPHFQPEIDSQFIFPRTDDSQENSDGIKL